MEKMFIDTNILIYATNPRSDFYKKARLKLEELSSQFEFVISSQILLEYAKTMTAGKKASLVWEQVEIFSEQFDLCFDNYEVFALWQEFSKMYQVKGNEAFDCYIVATMKANGINYLLTNNPKDFEVYNNIINIVKLKG